MSEVEKPMIVFPCESYPIKVVARADEGLRDRLDAVFVRFFGEFPAERVHERQSAQANFVAFTYEMTVNDISQLSELHEELKRDGAVVMVL